MPEGKKTHSKAAQIFKWLVVLVILLYVGLLFEKITEGEVRFVFTDFKYGGELESCLNQMFPKESGHIYVEEVVARITRAGAKCGIVTKSDGLPSQLKEYDYVAICEYSTGWLSFHMLEHYTVIIRGDKDHKLIGIDASRFQGFH